MLGTIDLVIIFAWLVFMLGLGKLLSRSVSNTDDFYLANRAMPVSLVICSLSAANLGMYNFISEAGQAAQQGVSIIWHEWTGNMAFAFSGLFILPAFRRLKLTTIPEFMGMRYGGKAHSITAVMYAFKSAGKLGTLLYLGALTGSVIIPQINFYWWMLIFTVVVGIYTYEGGMISVVFADAVQFILILLATLIGYAFIAGQVGWLDGIMARAPEGFFNFVPAGGKFDWRFILVIMFLGINAFTTDQGMIQRSFGSKNVRTLVAAMVLTGIILTPVNPFHFFAGLAAPILMPEAATMNPDAIMTKLYLDSIPVGLLGLFIVGLLASQLSTIDAELNAGATVLAKDIWQRVRRTPPNPIEQLRFSRYMTVVMTIAMISMALLVSKASSVVDFFLSLVSIFDTPIFVVAIIYGLKGRRINQAGAIAGYLGGAACGGIARVICTVYQVEASLWYITLSALIGALVITPLVSMLFAPPDQEKIRSLYRQESEDDRDWYHIIPRSLPGKFTLGLIILGGAMFFTGIVLGGLGHDSASFFAVGGMIVYFTGCAARLLFE